MHTRPLLAALLATTISSASAQQLVVDLFADGDARFTDYLSNAYAQVDLDPNGMYDLTTNQLYDSGITVFPFADAWLEVGALTLDGTPAGSGSEAFAITGANFDFGTPIDVSTAVVLSSSFSTTISNVTGNVTLTDGEVTTLSFSANVAFTFPADPSRPYNGTLTMTQDTFALAVDDTEEFGGFPIRLAWQATGTPLFTAVPEPGVGGLIGLAAVAGLFVYARRRRPSRA